MRVTSFIGEKDKMEEEEDKFLRNYINKENVEKELSDGGEQEVQSDEQGDEYG